ncbi:uncharacterized protein BX663DRAFT_554375 [Cokeromyces recurvatus]|uniref:uncharacterized protein n=1 Tax=Cokeromyces recurvatus TaxID=90255 RepID=UPI002220E86E|nr:uncharacterized protein BX663DRAFT_554375 [Cokeromyces recurvatus]KAI7900210.1 hypothetical protein BX663DRAFT_554375 [Cokeromyces recurvatus]
MLSQFEYNKHERYCIAALCAYTMGKNYTLNRLKEYTKDNSVTSSGGHDSVEAPKEGEPLKRSVNRRL